MTRLRRLRLGGAGKARKLLLNDRQTFELTIAPVIDRPTIASWANTWRTARAVPTPESIIVVIAIPGCNCNPWFRNINYLSKSVPGRVA